MDTTKISSFILAGIILGILFLSAFLIDKVESHASIIEHHCGEYNSTTGVFQFIDKDIK